MIWNAYLTSPWQALCSTNLQICWNTPHCSRRKEWLMRGNCGSLDMHDFLVLFCQLSPAVFVHWCLQHGRELLRITHWFEAIVTAWIILSSLLNGVLPFQWFFHFLHFPIFDFFCRDRTNPITPAKEQVPSVSLNFGCRFPSKEDEPCLMNAQNKGCKRGFCTISLITVKRTLSRMHIHTLVCHLKPSWYYYARWDQITYS